MTKTGDARARIHADLDRIEADLTEAFPDHAGGMLDQLTAHIATVRMVVDNIHDNIPPTDAPDLGTVVDELAAAKAEIAALKAAQLPI